MQLVSRVQPGYFPELSQTSVLRLGLHHLHPSLWTVPDEDFNAFQRHKLQVKSDLGDRVYSALPESRAAQRELHEHLLEHLVGDYPRLYSQQNGSLHHHASQTAWSLAEDSLWQTSLWVQEDLCLIEAKGKHHILTAASLCSPSNWKLEEKIGGTLERIHDPVPGYEEQLAEQVNRLFVGIKADKPLLRYNWSIQPGNELCWRKDYSPFPANNTESHWRIERQTLRRLPKTRAIVFGLRIFLHSFTVMEKVSGFKENLSAILERLPDAQKRYKGISV
jgi:dimethylamine monooxygenase subunit A